MTARAPASGGYRRDDGAPGGAPADSGFSGSYASDDVTFLLQPIGPDEAAALAVEPAEKERLIQSGRRHYSEMITPERAPSPGYMAIFDEALDRHGPRMGCEAARLVRGLDATQSGPITLVSLVRAGAPLGVLLTRGLRSLGREVEHYGVSIVRDRGIDHAAMGWILARRPPEGVVFIDGWTGKGAIADELDRTLATSWPAFAPRMVVLADPAGRAWLQAGFEDWLIPSGILGGTVSGLLSRTIVSPHVMRPGGFHATVRLDHLAAHDVSRAFVDRIGALMLDALPEAVVPSHAAAARDAARAAAEAAIDRVAQRFGIADRNRIKPGLAEATRAVLRRAPERILVASGDAPDLAGLRHLAERGGIAVEDSGPGLGPYRAITVIRLVGP